MLENIGSGTLYDLLEQFLKEYRRLLGQVADYDRILRRGDIIMKGIKRCFCNFSYYDQLAIQEKLEEMAEKGWRLEKPGSFMWTYKRIEPKRLRFSVTYFPSASDFDPGPTEGELTKIDYCRQDGWTLVASWGVMQIFCNEDLDAIPIETEPLMQVENICQSMNKNVFLPQTVLCGTLLWNIFLRFSQWRRDPVGELSSPFFIYSVLMFGILTLACLYEICFFAFWSRKAKAAARNDGVFLPIRSKPVVGRVLMAVSSLFLILSYTASWGALGFAMLWLCMVPLIIVIGNLLKNILKKRGFSRNVNRIVSVCAVVLLTFFMLGVLAAAIIQGRVRFNSKSNVIGTYDLYGITREIYNDSLPLEIEDLADVDAQWSKEADHQESLLLSSTEYRQYAVLTDGNDSVDDS